MSSPQADSGETAPVEVPAQTLDPAGLRALVESGRRNEAYRLYQQACEGVGDADIDPLLHYWGLMALARSGFILEAMKRYRATGLDHVDTRDFRLLPARLLKDLYFQTGRRHLWMVEQAGDLYRREYDRDRDGFPGINAAFLAFVADDTKTAHDLAGEIVSSLSTQLDPNGLADQNLPIGKAYGYLTLIEALYLSGHNDRATDLLSDLMHNAAAPQGAIDNFLRQLRRIYDHTGLRMPNLPARRQPGLMRFCGEIFQITGDPRGHPDAKRRPLLTESEAGRLRIEAKALLASRSCQIAVGALAAGADLIIAETALEAGCALQAVLPSGVDDFRARSVTPFGPRWEHAFETCLAHPKTTLTCLSGVLSDGPDLAKIYAGASDLTMGIALLLAEAETLAPNHLAAFTVLGTPDSQSRRDSATWRKHGLDAHEIVLSAAPPEPPETAMASGPGRGQIYVATIFCDLVGCSRMSEDETAQVFEDLYTEVGGELSAFSSVLESNTWGDAVFLVMTDAREAAEAALALKRFADERLQDTMGEGTTFRIACHYGPAYKIFDRIRGIRAYTGLSVVKTARIEPVTPPGEVYATQSFAGKLRFDGLEDYVLELVGEVPLAKKFGSEIVYSVRHKDFDLTPRQLAEVRESLAGVSTIS